MFDVVVAMTDIVTNFWSLGLKSGTPPQLINHGFRARDGWFVMQVGREAQFAKLVALIGHPEWIDDPRFATRAGWLEHLDGVLRPAIEGWAGGLTRVEACDALGPAGIAAGPCFIDEEVVVDPHLAARHMLVEMPRSDGVEQPVLIPGNPVKLSGVAEGPGDAGALAGRAHRRGAGRRARSERRRDRRATGRGCRCLSQVARSEACLH